MNNYDARESAPCRRVLVVTELVVSGTQCKCNKYSSEVSLVELATIIYPLVMDFGFIFRLTQKDRLELEQAYLDRLRTLKRKREIVPHRETHELVMGGKKVMMCERYSFPLVTINILQF